MKLKAAITDGTPQAVIDALGSTEFAQKFLTEICGEILGVKDPLERPAEFYVQQPDITVNVGLCCGVEVRLTGLTRNNRTPKQFHDALKGMHKLVARTVLEQLQKTDDDLRVQVFCVAMLDGDVETAPESGEYSNVLEHKPQWVRNRA